MAPERLYGLTRKQIELVRETCRHYLLLHGGGNERGKGKFIQQRHRQCRLTQDLLAAVDSWTDPSTATAHVYEKYNGTNDMRWSGETITIVNRFENISVDAGTYCKAEWIDGEWQLYAADCPGGSASMMTSESIAASASTGPP